MQGLGDNEDMNRAIHHPDYRVPILTWWEGIYSHVFVALHPFFRVHAGPNLDVAPQSLTFEDLVEYGQEGWKHDAVKKCGIGVPWSEIHQAVAPEISQEEVYRAIWLLSCCGLVERAGIPLQNRISSYCEKEQLFLPESDGMAAIMEPVIGRFLAGFNASSVTAFDEFRHHAFEIPVSAFEAGEPSLLLEESVTSAAVWGLHLADPGVLITWEFDGSEALIALTSRAKSRVRPEQYFEGWYVDSKAYCDIFNPPDFFARDL